MRRSDQSRPLWIAFDPFEEVYYDSTPMDSTLETIQTLEQWGEEGATIELVSGEEADQLFTGQIPRRIHWRWPFTALFSFIQFFFRMTFNLIVHPIDTLYRLVTVLVLWWIITLGVQWLYQTHLVQWL